MKDMNSWDSFKKDAKDVAGFVVFAAIIFWAVFYPFAMMVGASNIKDSEERAKFWGKFWKAPATWLWLVCVAIVVAMIICNWHSYLKSTF